MPDVPVDQPRRIVAGSASAEWQTLRWDSELFGFSAGRVNALCAEGDRSEIEEGKRGALAAVLADCEYEGVRHLCARVDAGDISSIHAFEAAGFELIDGILNFELALPTDHASVPEGTREFRIDDLAVVVAIGRTAFVHDRFHMDPALSPEIADNVNAVWTYNCCVGKAADGVVLAELHGQVASYVTCRLDQDRRIGTIVLVATADWARGQGAARRATLASLSWFQSRGVDKVQVGTQMRNIPAGRLYESLGFRLIGTSLTFRKLL